MQRRHVGSNQRDDSFFFFLVKNVCLAVIKQRCRRRRPGPRTLLLLHASPRPQGGGPGRGSSPPKIPTTSRPLKPALEEPQPSCLPPLCFIFFFCPLYYRGFKRQIWPPGWQRFAAAAALQQEFPCDHVISTPSFMSSTPQTSCKILNMENCTSDRSSVCVNLCSESNSPQMDHVLRATYFQLMGEFLYLKTFSSTSGGGRTMKNGRRRQSSNATRCQQFRGSNRKASCILTYLPLPYRFHH